MDAETTPKRTPLYDAHLKANAKMVPFAGFSLPVQYTSVIKESEAVRNGAGMFDVSHMARLVLEGDRVLEYLEQITSNDVSKLVDGTGQYSLLTNLDGGVVDDIIVYRLSPADYRMVVNAANHDKDWAWMNEQNHFGVKLIDVTQETAMIAVQGPQAAEIIRSLFERPEEIDAAGMFGVVQGELAGVPCFMARSGYTGEDGFEVICAAPVAERVWDALVENGVVLCGLGSRDVLRVEAGLPLYGHELGDDFSPIEAGLGWVVGKEKSFNGSDAIRAVQQSGPQRKLQGIKLGSKRIPQPGAAVVVENREVGTVSSGVYSPLLGCGIAFAFLDPEVKIGTDCTVEVRGTLEPAVVHAKRFFKRSS
ncbi:MAG: glycine cleavage system aminomethyltransferase GcvT [Fimbriimonadaceae bacterium]